MAATGGEIKDGVLFRSDALDGLGVVGRARLAELGITTVIDLRDDVEAAMMPDDLAGLAIDIRRVPVLAGNLASQLTTDLTDLYLDMVENGSAALAEALRIIAASPGPVVVHCTAGKDRTGVVVALALLGAGADRDQVLDDYAASGPRLRGRWLDRVLERALDAGVVVPDDRLSALTASPRDVLAGVVEMLLRRHESVPAYLDSIGLSSDEVAALRTALVRQPLDTAAAHS